MDWLADRLHWFEERLVLRGGGGGLLGLLPIWAATVNRTEELLGRPRYLMLLIMATCSWSSSRGAVTLSQSLHCSAGHLPGDLPLLTLLQLLPLGGALTAQGTAGPRRPSPSRRLSPSSAWGSCSTSVWTRPTPPSSSPSTGPWARCSTTTSG